MNWSDPNHKIRTYFYINSPGLIDISFRAKIRAGVSKIRVSFNGRSREHSLTNTGFRNISAGKFRIEEKGYHFVEFSGLEKTGNTFAEITAILLETAVKPSNFNFYQG